MVNNRNDSIVLSASGPLKGEIYPPPDKSLSHRSVIIASIAKGKSRIENLLRAEDPMSTLNAMRSLGVEILDKKDAIEVQGKGLHALREPEDVIDCGNSGTTIRLLTGLLSGQPFSSILTGDDSLRKRPMKRVITPLRMMGAHLSARYSDTFPPLCIHGGNLRGISYKSPVASAQVKSAILLAGLYADGSTYIEEPQKSRDHTERILPALGAKLRVEGLKVTIEGGSELRPFEMIIPGDFSSAAFFIAAASIVKESEVLIKNVGINPTRTGFFSVLKRMGVRIEILNECNVSGEPVADLLCRYTKELKAVEVGADEIITMIDEFPVFTVLATQADGTTTIRGAEELRIKESDRIATMASELREMGVKVEEYPDGLSIQGPVKLKGAPVHSHHDHRVAMALTVASLISDSKTIIHGVSAVNVSYPAFFENLKSLSIP